MTVASMCRSRQAPAPITRPDRVVRSCSSGRLQQQPVVSQLRGLSVATSRVNSASTLGSGIGLAGSLRWRSCKTSTTTCMLHEGSPGLRADERSSLAVEQNFGQGRHGKEGVSAAVAAGSIAAPSTDHEIAATAAPRFAPPIPDLKKIQQGRRFFCYATSFLVVAVTCFVQTIMHPFVLAFDKQHRTAHHLTMRVWAILSTHFFYKTEVEGRENLPAAEDGPVVFVANHQSFLDVYPLYQVKRPFTFVSKSDNFRIPFLGIAMHMTGYIALLRTDPKSQLMCLRKCMDLVKEGMSVLFFPEGTRATDGTLAAFKKGAFKVAAREGVPVVPITIIGTGKLMPKGFEYIFRSGIIKMVIHPPIRSKSADVLCNQSRKVIAETLLQHGLPVHEPALTA